MKLGFFLKEATRSMRRNPAPSFAALSCVLVTTLVLGVFIPVVQATNGAANSIRGRVVVDVDLNTTATPAEVARARHEVEHARYAGHVELVSKKAGYEQERKINPAAFQLIGYNPLPDILRVTPSNPDQANALRAELDQASPAGTRLVTDPAIAAVQNRQAQTDKILSARSPVVSSCAYRPVASSRMMRPRRSSITRRRILSTSSLSWVATITVVPARLMR